MKKTILAVACVVALLMMTGISFAANQNAMANFIWKATYNWVDCGDGTSQLVTTVSGNGCYELVSWQSDLGSGLEALETDTCGVYTNGELPVIYDAQIAEWCAPVQYCTVYLKGGSNTPQLFLNWLQGPTCDNYLDVTADGTLTTKKGNTAAISYVGIKSCTPTTDTCPEI